MKQQNQEEKQEDSFAVGTYILLVLYLLIAGISDFLLNNNSKTEHL